jgi:hypothetical protein
VVYCTPTDIKTWLGGFEDVGIAADAELTALIVQVQAAIDRYCHRTFEAASDTSKSFDAIEDVGNGTWSDYGVTASWRSAQQRRTLHLDFDLCAIASITNGDGVVVTSDQYVVQPRRRTPWHSIILKQNSNVAWTFDDGPENAIVISGRWAYSTTAPDDIKMAATRLAAWSYRQGENYDSGSIDRPIMSPSGVVLLPSRWPEAVKTLLNPFRRL